MKFIKCLFLFSFLALTAIPGNSQTVNVDKNNVALGGYDVVSYHIANAAIRGNNGFVGNHSGSTYYFSNAENLQAFNANPKAYLPEFGGFCAFAMAMKGVAAPTDPETFKIRDGKLYLFFNDFYEGKPFNTIIPWNGSEKEMLSKANTNWAKL